MSTSDPAPDERPPAAGDPAAPGRPPGTRPAPATAEHPVTGSAAGPVRSEDAFPVPHGPRTTSAGGHLLGVLVGLVLTAAALVLLTLGQSRLAADVGRETVLPDPFGITLVTVGAVLTAVVALLAVRSSAIPFTGGLLAVLAGAAALFAPVQARRETVGLLATDRNRDALLSVVGVATTGTLFTLGLVLLATGTAASLVRRRGIEVGSFRERTSGQAPGRR